MPSKDNSGRQYVISTCNITCFVAPVSLPHGKHYAKLYYSTKQQVHVFVPTLMSNRKVLLWLRKPRKVSKPLMNCMKVVMADRLHYKGTHINFYIHAILSHPQMMIGLHFSWKERKILIALSIMLTAHHYCIFN